MRETTNGSSTGGRDSWKTAESELPPAQVVELAEACERFVFGRYKVKLDRTSDTLSLVDHYIVQARADVQARPESLPLLQGAIGAYFGEVIRSRYDAFWLVDPYHEQWRLCFRSVWLTFNPIGMAREALLGYAADGWHAHLHVDDAYRNELSKRLATLPPVDASEFYALATRWDVLELAIEVLTSGTGENPNVVLTEEDYRTDPWP